MKYLKYKQKASNNNKTRNPCRTLFQNIENGTAGNVRRKYININRTGNKITKQFFE